MLENVDTDPKFQRKKIWSIKNQIYVD